jgi:hypothetical protein
MSRARVAESVRPWRTSEFPQALSLQDYTRAISRFVEKVSMSPSVVGVFQIGSVSRPGISDIDLVVVLRDGTKEVPVDLRRALALEGLGPLDRCAFMHGPFVFDERSAPGLFLHYDIRSLIPHAGDVAVFGHDELNAARDVALLVDFTIELYQQFLLCLTTRRLRVRPTLCLLQSFVYSLETFQRITGSAMGAAGTYASQVSALRAEALKADPHALVTEVARLVDVAARLASAVLSRLADGILRSPDYLGNSADGDPALIRWAPGSYLLFAEDDGRNAIDRSLELSIDTDSRLPWRRAGNRIVSVVPGLLQSHYRTYSSSPTIVGANIRSRLRASSVPDDRISTYRHFLLEKTRVADLQRDALARAGLREGQLLLAEIGQPMGRSSRGRGIANLLHEAYLLRRVRVK